MLLDRFAQFYNGETKTSDEASPDTYDNGLTGTTSVDALGTGDPLYFCVAVDDLATGGNRTYNVRLEHAGGVTNTGALDSGKATIMTLNIPNDQAERVVYGTVPAGIKFSRYLGAAIDVGGTSPTAKWWVWLSHLQPDSNADEKYPDAVNFADNI